MEPFSISTQIEGSDKVVGVVVVDSSNGTSSVPDPRWPYLSRWTQKSPLSLSTNLPAVKEMAKTTPLEIELSSTHLDISCEDVPVVQSFVSTPVAKSMSLEEASTSPLSSSLKGAWSVPLNLNRMSDAPLASTSPNISKKSTSVDVLCKNSSHLALNMETQPETAQDEATRFPWAAKMDPSSRNLYRATSPEYLEDGTPKVTIPSHVLLQGLENQKEYILGQFYRCSPPPGGLVHAVVNRIWGRKCRIFVRKLGESKFLFHIPDASTRAWVLQRGLWHVDDCLMFVASWSTADSLAIPDISTVPVWVTLKNIPNRLYSIAGISHIASGLGAPMATYKPRLDPSLMGEAKILVEVELSKAFPTRIAAADKKGFISMVDVEYAWVPTKCGKCGQLGHKISRCASEKVAPPSDASVLADTVLVSPNLVISVPPNSDSIKVSEAHVVTPNIINNVPIHNTDQGTMVIANQSIVDTEVVVQATSTFQREKISAGTKDKEVPSDCLTLVTEASVGNVLGKNRFTALDSSELDEDSHDSDNGSEMMDLMTPSGQRLLRERPVKPSFKAKEMAGSKARGRGNRGRGNRGGRG